MSKSKPVHAVTVIIPAFNVAQWLPSLFDGLDQQTFRDFETIFVNDGSTDGTGVLLDVYAASRERVKIIHQPNGGVGTARNTGVDAAKGDFIVFIDADDAISSSHLADLYSLANSFDLDVAMCNGWHFLETPGDTNQSIVTISKPEGVMSGVKWFETTFNSKEWWDFAWMMMVRREFLNRHTIRFMDRVCHQNIPWVAMVQARAERVSYTPKQSYYYRKTPGSIVNNKSLPGKIRRIESYICVIEELWQMADSETSRIAAELFGRLAIYEGRFLLGFLSEIGSFRQRIAISRELLNRGFLAHLFREVETGMHRKRIARAYFFACLGMIAELLMIGEKSLNNIERNVK